MSPNIYVTFLDVKFQNLNKPQSVFATLIRSCSRNQENLWSADEGKHAACPAASSSQSHTSIPERTLPPRGRCLNRQPSATGRACSESWPEAVAANRAGARRSPPPIPIRPNPSSDDAAAMLACRVACAAAPRQTVDFPRPNTEPHHGGSKLAGCRCVHPPVWPDTQAAEPSLALAILVVVLRDLYSLAPLLLARDRRAQQIISADSETVLATGREQRGRFKSGAGRVKPGHYPSWRVQKGSGQIIRRQPF